MISRFLSEDPLGIDGGNVNLYSYTTDAPSNFTDPDGKSLWPVHVAETYLGALAAGDTSSDALNLAIAVANVDFQQGSQDTDAAAANGHAMAGTTNGWQYQNPEQAYEGAQSELLNNAMNGNDAAAIHAIQDSNSSSHDYQPWQPWNNILGHIGADLLPSINAINQTALYLRERRYGFPFGFSHFLKPPMNGRY